jgi:hypothetical protein
VQGLVADEVDMRLGDKGQFDAEVAPLVARACAFIPHLRMRLSPSQPMYHHAADMQCVMCRAWCWTKLTSCSATKARSTPRSRRSSRVRATTSRSCL